MISLSRSLRVFVCTKPTDMRRSFNGLFVTAEQLMEQDPLSGNLFDAGDIGQYFMGALTRLPQSGYFSSWHAISENGLLLPEITDQQRQVFESVLAQ